MADDSIQREFVDVPWPPRGVDSYPTKATDTFYDGESQKAAWHHKITTAQIAWQLWNAVWNYEQVVIAVVAIDPDIQNAVSKEIIRQIIYLIMGPLGRFELATAREQDHPFPQYQQALKDLWDRLAMNRFHAAIYGDGAPADAPYVTPATLSSLSPIELIVKLLVDRAPQGNRIRNISGVILGLKSLAVVYDMPADRYIGLPKVFFVCSGHPTLLREHADLPAGQTNLVFTATKNNWGDYKPAKSYQRAARLDRYDGSDEAARARLAVQRTRSINYYNRCETNGNTINAREQTCNSWNANDAYAHGTERARAFFLPKMDRRSPCFKCRALYRYDWVHLNDGPSPVIWTDKRYHWTDCAESLANDICSKRIRLHQ